MRPGFPACALIPLALSLSFAWPDDRLNGNPGAVCEPSFMR